MLFLLLLVVVTFVSSTTFCDKVEHQARVVILDCKVPYPGRCNTPNTCVIPNLQLDELKEHDSFLYWFCVLGKLGEDNYTNEIIREACECYVLESCTFDCLGPIREDEIAMCETAHNKINKGLEYVVVLPNAD